MNETRPSTPGAPGLFRRSAPWPIVMLAGAMVASASAVDWPSFRGPDYSAASPEKILVNWPAAGPRELWRIALANGFSGFSISQGKVFTLVSRTVADESREICLALEANTGRELWAVPIGLAKYAYGGDDGAAGNRGGDGPRSTPTVAGERVFVLNAYLGLTCLDRDTGSIMWYRDLIQDYRGSGIGWQNSASPVIDDGLLFVNVNRGDEPPLIALRTTDGQEAWQAGRSEDRLTHATPVLATVLGVRQVIFLTQYGLVGLETKTGRELWRHRFPFRTSTGASPVVCDDRIYCSAGYTIGAAMIRLQPKAEGFEAVEIWRTPNQLENQWSTPVYYQGYLYGLYGHGEYGGAPLKCVDAATGVEQWSERGFGLGGITLVSGHLLVLSDYGDLVLVPATPSGYAERARWKALAGKCWNLVAISNGRVYARSTKEGVCAEVAQPIKAPLRLSASQDVSAGFRLSIETGDGTALEATRTETIEVWTSSQATPDGAEWSRITNAGTLSNGVFWLEDPGYTNRPQRFFRARESSE